MGYAKLLMALIKDKGFEGIESDTLNTKIEH